MYMMPTVDADCKSKFFTYIEPTKEENDKYWQEENEWIAKCELKYTQNECVSAASGASRPLHDPYIGYLSSPPSGHLECK